MSRYATRSSEFIYIIAEKTEKRTGNNNGYTGYYKVGRTDNVARRVEELQTGNPNQLECIKYYQVSNASEAERAAHAAVNRDYRSNEKGGTEWYCAPLSYQSDFIQRVGISVLRFLVQ